ncbi:MAG TPA: type II toxin-antitoxin system HicA family toxin [Aggregatilineales bacterium]|nr:type II toxin-antitoxin system HicA family toxin [Anaerolineales bacterium]HRE47123.1 type II toxin-antitoxin system HicA family toxin [Aggregatilineales bacterium]
MSRNQKTLKQILAGSQNIRFEDFIALLIGFGFILKRVNGSHHVFGHPKIQRPFPVQPLQNKAKIYQAHQLLRLVEQYDLHLDDEDAE